MDVKTDDTLLFRLADDNLLHIAFKVDPDASTLLDAMSLGVAAYMHYHRPINTVVLCEAAIDAAPDTLDTGSLTVQVTNVMLGREDGPAILGRLRRMARHGEPFTSADRVDFILLPLLRHDRALRALLPEVVEAALALPEAERATVVVGLAALAIRYADAEFARAPLEELHMTETLDALIDDGIRRDMSGARPRGWSRASAPRCARCSTRASAWSPRPSSGASQGRMPRRSTRCWSARRGPSTSSCCK